MFRYLLCVSKRKFCSAVSKLITVGYPSSTSINLKKFTEKLNDRLTQVNAYQQDHYAVVEGKALLGKENAAAFAFKDGSIVFWDVPKTLQRKLLVDWTGCELTEATLDSEELELAGTSGDPWVSSEGTVFLRSADFVSDRIAVVLATKAAVRLNWLERSIEAQIHRERKTIEKLRGLAKGLRMTKIAEQIFQSKTTLHEFQYCLSVEPDLQAVPDCLWESDIQSRLYSKLCKHFDLQPRIGLLNARLGLTNDFLDTVADFVDRRSSNRLEKVIIVLIFLELSLALFEALRN